MKKLIFAIILFFLFMPVFALPDGFDGYLEGQCLEARVPAPVVYAILLQENPELNPQATHKNTNGTTDLGLFQLNDRYVYSDFIPRYWKREEAFRWDDPFHSAYIAVRHIRWLYDLFWEQPTPQAKAFSASLAYNCGFYAVMTGNVPASSARYAANVINSVWRAE